MGYGAIFITIFGGALLLFELSWVALGVVLLFAIICFSRFGLAGGWQRLKNIGSRRFDIGWRRGRTRV